MHLWSYLGKLNFSPSLVGQMIFLMTKMITRHKYLSNELSWAQFGVEEGIQKLTATTLFLEAASLGTFWPVLGDLIFDRENELQIKKFQLGWKVDSNTFPTSYPAPNSDTRKASKSLLQVRGFLGSARLWEGNFSKGNYTCADIWVVRGFLGNLDKKLIQSANSLPSSPKFVEVCLLHVLCGGVMIAKEDYDHNFMQEIDRG